MDRLASQQSDLPSLRSWLHERSAAERRTLARLWRLGAGEDIAGAEDLLEKILTPQGLAALLEGLRSADRVALERLQAEGGAMPARVFEREFGTVREHHAYPNPRAYLEALANPPSATERLFVLGLIQQRRTPDGRMYAIPAELVQLLPPVPLRDRRLRLELAAPQETQSTDPGRIEREIVGLLAAAYEAPLPVRRDGRLRRPTDRRSSAYLAAALAADGEALPAALSERATPRLGFLRQLALELGLLRRTRRGLRPTPDALQWLEQPASERRRRLLQAWLSCGWDELTALCGLCWRAEPLRRSYTTPRRALLELLAQQQPGQWFDLEAWVAEIRRIEPDFQRPDGMYDTWMLVDESGESRIGFQHWELVEGRLARAVVAGPLAWLGLVDLGRQSGREQWSTARLNGWGAALIGGEAAPPAEEEHLVTEANFTVFAPPLAPPLPRFQLSRIAEWEGHGSFDFYRLTRERFSRALDRGIESEEILAFLERWSAEPLPQNVAYTLREWARERQALQLRPALLLEADDPLRLERLRRDRRVKLPPLQPIGERYWALPEADGRALVAELRRAGYGVTAELPSHEEPLSERDLAELLAFAQAVGRLAERYGLKDGPSAALQRRIEQRLPSALAAAAGREATALVERLLQSDRSQEKERDQ